MKKKTTKRSSAKRRSTTKKHGKSSQNAVRKEMRKFKKGTARSGKGLAKVKSRKQAVAIGLSKARKKGAKAARKSTKR